MTRQLTLAQAVAFAAVSWSTVVSLPIERRVVSDPDPVVSAAEPLPPSAPPAPQEPLPPPLPHPDPPPVQTCEGVPCQWIPVSLPFEHTGDLTGRQGWIDQYPCAPTTVEGGGEDWYVVDIEEPGTLVAEVLDGLEVDIDLHLLKGPSSETCVARAHRRLEHGVVPGRYWLVADAFTAQDGVKEGPYQVRVHVR